MQEIILIAQTIVSRPLVPQFIFDDNTRIFVCLIGIIMCWAVLVEIIRRYNK